MEFKTYDTWRIVSVLYDAPGQLSEVITFDKKGKCIERSIFASSANGTLSLNGFFNVRAISDRTIIHSIERLSDGQIFTLGDIISAKEWKEINGSKEDKIITISFDKTRPIRCEKGWIVDIEDIISSMLICITEDNVRIYSNLKDAIVKVDENFNYSSIKLENTKYECELYKDDKKTKFFSSQIAAKEYIIFNKPCISITDLVSEEKNKLPIFNLNNKKRKEIAESLYNLVKSKL